MGPPPRALSARVASETATPLPPRDGLDKIASAMKFDARDPDGFATPPLRRFGGAVSEPFRHDVSLGFFGAPFPPSAG